MHFDKPKPIHSWRDFLKEVGTIVVGVCIALTAEQIVEAAHWKHKVREVEASLHKELAEDNGPQAVERLRIFHCVDVELDRLERGLLDSRDQGAPFRTAKLIAPAFHSWDADAWRVAVASDVTSHMPTPRMYSWSQAYALIPHLDQVAQREAHSWARLRVVEVAPARPSAAQIEDRLQAIAEARGDNALLKTMSETFLQNIVKAGVQMTDVQQRILLPRDLARWPGCYFTR